jgi:arylsulfatase A-like enzyme
VLGGLGALSAVGLGGCRRNDGEEAIETEGMDMLADPPPLPLCQSAMHDYEGRKQHVLFLSIDDLNDWVGVLGGHPQARTPNLDKLAKHSVLFTNAHCAAPACNPSRAATLTGLRPTTTGVYGNRHPWRQALPDAVSLPSHFRANGFKTVGGGKIFHPRYPDPDAWDEYFPDACSQRPDDPKPKGLPASGVAFPGPLDWGPLDVGKEATADAIVSDWAVEQLMKAGDDLLFLAVGINRPHLPWYLPDKYFDMFPLDTLQLPEVLPTDREDIPPIAFTLPDFPDDYVLMDEHKTDAAAVQAYLAAVAFADEMVGKVLDALEASPIAEDTVVVLWSDHGWHLGEKLHWRKYSLWEEATRVPLMIRAPDFETGLTCARPVNLMDIYPTLTDLCGLQPPYALDGMSLVPFLEDPMLDLGCGSVTSWLRGNDSVRTDRWRYTRYRDGTAELYDHETDPLEWVNLSGRPEHAELEAQLATFLPQTVADAVPDEDAYSEDDFECGLPD